MARSEGECSCAGVDWRSAREVELEAKIGDSVSGKEYRDLHKLAHDQAFRILELEVAKDELCKAKIAIGDRDKSILFWMEAYDGATKKIMMLEEKIEQMSS